MPTLPTLKDLASKKDARLAFLKSLPLFEGVTDMAILDALADKAGHFTRSPDGVNVVNIQGNEHGMAFIVLSGLLEISQKDDEQGTTFYLPYRGPGEPGGQNALICGIVHPYTVRAVMPTHMLSLSGGTLLAAFKQSPEFARNLLHNLTLQFGDASRRAQRIADLTAKESRVLVELLEICEKLEKRYVDGVPGEDPAIIRIDWLLPREDFARKIGCSKDSVSKGLQKLKEPQPLIHVVDVTGVITIERDLIPTLRKISKYLSSQNLEQAVASGLNEK